MTNKLTQRERERVPIKDNTKKGYSLAEDGDGIDLGLHRKNHRGTVQHQISHTIKTEMDCGVIEIEYKSNRNVKAERKVGVSE